MEGHFSINNFKSAIDKRGGFARSHYFECKINPQGDPLQQIWGFVGHSTDQFLCRAATLPMVTIETTELRYFTRSVKLGGRRYVEPITLTFFNTGDYKLRTTLLLWQELVSTERIENTRWRYQDYPLSAGDMGRYGQIILNHFDIGSGKVNSQLKSLMAKSKSNQSTSQTNNVKSSKYIPSGLPHRWLAKYTMEYAFPTIIGNPTFAFDNEDIQTFDVTFECLDISCLNYKSTSATVETNENIKLPVEPFIGPINE